MSPSPRSGGHVRRPPPQVALRSLTLIHRRRRRTTHESNNPTAVTTYAASQFLGPWELEAPLNYTVSHNYSRPLQQ